MFALFTLGFGLAPDYVLDRMEIYEMKALLKYSYHKNREMWESQRLVGWCAAFPHLKKKIKQQDIAKFPWDSNMEAARKVKREESAQRATQFEKMIQASGILEDGGEKVDLKDLYKF